MAKDESRHRILEILIHLMAWMVIFSFPQMMFVREEGFFSALSHSVPLLIGPALLALVFYLNYLWLVPRLMDNHNVRQFVILNVLLIISIQTLNGFWNYSCQLCLERTEITQWENEGMPDSLYAASPGYSMSGDSVLGRVPLPPPGHEGSGMFGRPAPNSCCGKGAPVDAARHGLHHPGPQSTEGWIALLVTIRDFLTYLLLVALAVVLHMSFRFRKADMARKQAEYRRTETELQSLKNQVSPHFLLNTLNNIYALVVIDQTQAQEAIINLSRLLSHMLYQNRDTYTTLEREVDFLRHYVDLMRLRISSSVQVEFVDNMNESGSLPIAPLIFISLIENAFKHGISGNEGHISIRITGSVQDGVVHADIRNSNHPKSPEDKSGHGVGLQLVRRRLELLYPRRFRWEQGIDREHNEYYSLLTIHTR